MKMAMSMDPVPELIVFLTDGSNGSADESMKVAKELATEAKEKSIKVNTIALMEPKARESMSHLAKTTGGEFSLIGADGKKVQQAGGGIKKR